MSLNARPSIVLLLAMGLLALTGASWRAPLQQKPQCPVTKVICPAEVHKKDKLVIRAEVKGGDKDVTPTYNWSISAGTIASGQGMATIEVDMTEVAEDSSITATVELGGYDRDC